jgi:S1-C subfamily serine protease
MPRKSRPSRALVATLAVLAVALVVVSVIAFSLGEGLSSLQGRVEELSGELVKLSGEVASLRNELASLKLSGPPSQPSSSVEEIYEMVKASVVMVKVERVQGFFVTRVQGSGFVYSASGYILTNNHVVEGARSIQVAFLDGTIVEAELVGADPYSDVGVIRVDASKLKLTPLSLGDSSRLRVGEQIVAVGNPFGLTGTLTTGVVSQVGRLLPTDTGFSIPGVIQIDAAINPGNSGGPLLNLRGEVVGITTAIQSSTGEFSGIGLAIPSNIVRRVAQGLIENRKYDHPWLGVRGSDVDYELAKVMKLEITKGFLITDVVDGGPAQKAGLRGGNRLASIEGTPIKIGGDVIVKVDEIAIRGLEDMLWYLEENKSPGDQVKLEVVREGKILSVYVTLGARPPYGYSP